MHEPGHKCAINLTFYFDSAYSGLHHFFFELHAFHNFEMEMQNSNILLFSKNGFPRAQYTIKKNYYQKFTINLQDE